MLIRIVQTDSYHVSSNIQSLMCLLKQCLSLLAERFVLSMHEPNGYVNASFLNVSLK